MLCQIWAFGNHLAPTWRSPPGPPGNLAHLAHLATWREFYIIRSIFLVPHLAHLATWHSDCSWLVAFTFKPSVRALKKGPPGNLARLAGRTHLARLATWRSFCARREKATWPPGTTWQPGPPGRAIRLA